MKDKIKTASFYKERDGQSVTDFSNNEFCVLGWDAKKASYLVLYRVFGRYRDNGCGKIVSRFNKYYFSNLKTAARHYKRLCKYRPLFVS